MLPYLKVPLIWQVALYLHLLGFSRFSWHRSCSCSEDADGPRIRCSTVMCCGKCDILLECFSRNETCIPASHARLLEIHTLVRLSH